MERTRKKKIEISDADAGNIRQWHFKVRQSDPETHLMFKMLDLSFAVAMRQCHRACAGKKKLSATNNKHPVVPTQVAQVPNQPTRSEDVSHSDEIGIDPTDAVLQPRPSQPGQSVAGLPAHAPILRRCDQSTLQGTWSARN